MPRSVGVFQQQGWKVLPYPVDFRGQPFSELHSFFSLSDNLGDLVMAVREWTGLVAYRLSGKTGQLLPTSLDRQVMVETELNVTVTQKKAELHDG